MSLWRSERLRTHLRRGLATSILVHGAVLFPLTVLAFIWGAEEAARRAEEVNVEFRAVDPSTLPPDLLPTPDDSETLPPPPDEAKKKKKELLAQAREERLPRAPEPEVQAPKPEELKKLPEVQPPPEQPKEPVPPPPPKAHEKMVDLDNDKEVEPPPDAKYLAQKNNRALEETRAMETNLERAQKGVESSAPSPLKDNKPGAEEDRIAELEDQKSKLGREAPRMTPHENPALSEGASQPQSLLSMREKRRLEHEITPETADPSLPRDPEGIRALPEYDLESTKDITGRKGTASRVRLKLTADQMKYIVGEDAEAAERFAQKQKSQRKGRFTERAGKIQSALENFIPEVKPGNQTALNTRAAPFAAFIARMHRSIHKLWGFGYLEELDAKSSSSPYNNPNLMAQLEIVLNADGTIDNVKVIRPSGFTPFDVAAVDVALSAGPFPDPPREIRSGNGKIYLHWKFHRDERQCATSGVDYYILNNAPAGGDKGEAAAAGGGDGHDHGGEQTQRLQPGLPGEARRPASESSGSTGLKRLERGVESPAHRATTSANRATAREPGPAGSLPEPDQEATRRVQREVVRPDDPEARAVGTRWFDAFARGEVAKMLREAAFPFRSTGGVAARSARELEMLLKDLMSEATGKRRVVGLQTYSAAGARGVLGTLPPGFGDGGGLLFAVAHVSGDLFVLVLQQLHGSWRAVGLVRR